MVKQTLLIDEIRDHFTRKTDYRFRLERTIAYHPYDDFIKEFVTQNLHDESRILEVGGGSGYKIDLIGTTVGTKNLFNCEFVPNVYKNQVQTNITLIGGNALQLPFRSNYFDLVLSINLLHHLVGPTIKDTQNNQAMALSEILRVARKDGFFIIGEICNKSRFIRAIIYQLCKIACKGCVRIKLIGIDRNVIVCFMTLDELIDCIDALENDLEIKTGIYDSWPLDEFSPKRILANFLQKHILITCKKL